MEACCSLAIDGDEQAKLTSIFRALGNETRFEILKFLLTHPGCITGDIVDHLPLAQATVSQHLKVLKETGLVKGEIEGTATCYCLNDDILEWFRATVEEVF